jgi:chitinase
VTPNDIEPALSSCSHLVYGFSGINSDNFKIAPLISNEEFDETKGLFKQITSLKAKFPKLKVLLSVGGDADGNHEKYFKLLESNTAKIAFTNSVNDVLKKYNFDGLDLAFQFPKMKPKKVRSTIGGLFYGLKKAVGAAGKPVDEQSEEHKNQFTSLVVELKNSFRIDNFELSLTVLPNVNATLYFDIPAIKNFVDFVTVSAFDVYTPNRNPDEADYVSPILSVTDRNTEETFDAWSTFLTKGGLASNRVVYGVPTFGRAWNIEKDATITGSPPIKTAGAAPEGTQSRTPGLFSYPEICMKVENDQNKMLKGENAPLKRGSENAKRYGIYAVRLPDANGKFGMWVGYDDPESIGSKASYVKGAGFGGVAIFDLSLEDFRGACSANGLKFPLVTKIKEKLN